MKLIASSIGAVVVVAFICTALALPFLAYFDVVLLPP
jgi:hypothetical protein